MDELLKEFPKMDFAMAYGSVPFAQEAHDSSNSMIDFVFAVPDPALWHTKNLQKFPEHYSAIGNLNVKTICSLQSDFGAGLYYNTLVSMPKHLGKRKMKYGIISTNDLCQDLQQWTHLYISGRMHKPVNVLQSNSKSIEESMAINHKSALRTALLLLPCRFSEEELYRKIAGLSYAGDFRMTFGENPKKVENIVAGNFEAFRNLYKDILQRESSLVVGNSKNTFFEQDNSPETRAGIIEALPRNLLCKMKQKQSINDLSRDLKSNRVLKQCLSSIVSRSSRTQSVKGLLTAGVFKRKVSDHVRNQLAWCLYSEFLENDGGGKSRSSVWKRASKIAGKISNPNVAGKKRNKSGGGSVVVAKEISDTSTGPEEAETIDNQEVEIIDMMSEAVDDDKKFAERLIDSAVTSEGTGTFDVSITALPVTGEGNHEYNAPCSASGCTLTVSSTSEQSLVSFGGRFQRDESIIIPRTMVKNAFEPKSYSCTYYSDQLHELNLQTSVWRIPMCTGNVPESRCDHTAVFVPPHQLFIFGGRGDKGKVFNDLFVLCLRNWHWTEIQTQVRPPSRYWHSAVFVPECNIICVYGGRSVSCVFDDFWTFDVAAYNRRKKQELWTESLLMGIGPGKRFGGAMLPLLDNRLIYFGGWHFNPESGITEVHRKSVIEMYMLDLETMIWNRPRAPTYILGAPAPECRLLFPYYRLRNTILLFGGLIYPTPSSGGLQQANATTYPLDDPFVHRFDLETRIWTRKKMSKEALAYFNTATKTILSSGEMFVMQSYGEVDKVLKLVFQDTENTYLSA